MVRKASEGSVKIGWLTYILEKKIELGVHKNNLNTIFFL